MFPVNPFVVCLFCYLLGFAYTSSGLLYGLGSYLSWLAFFSGYCDSGLFCVPIWKTFPLRSWDSNSIEDPTPFAFVFFSSWFLRTNAKNLIRSFFKRLRYMTISTSDRLATNVYAIEKNSAQNVSVQGKFLPLRWSWRKSLINLVNSASNFISNPSVNALVRVE